MGSLLHLKRRIKSARNISQITKAMEMVSASKMKRAQDQALNARPFAEKLEDMIKRLSLQVPTYQNPLLESRNSTGNVGLVVVATNKGLCGGLNVNLIKELLRFASDHKNANFSLITIGKKAKRTLPGYNSELVAKFDGISENPDFEEVRAISRLIMENFSLAKFDSVYVAYPKFISTLKSDIVIKRLLPVRQEKDDQPMPSGLSSEYLVEPSPKAVLDYLIAYEIEMTLYQIILESRASEHSARMVAMKNASDNASELIQNLTLDYNQARQSQVTSELLDVTSARMALVN